MATPTWKSVMLDFRAPNQLKQDAYNRFQTSGKNLGATMQKPEQDALAKADKDFQNALAQQQANDLNTRQEDRQLHDIDMLDRGQENVVTNKATDQTNAVELAGLNKKPKQDSWSATNSLEDYWKRNAEARNTIDADEKASHQLVAIALDSPEVKKLLSTSERQAALEWMHQGGSWKTLWNDNENAGDMVTDPPSSFKYLQKWDLTQNKGQYLRRKYDALDAMKKQLSISTTDPEKLAILLSQAEEEQKHLAGILEEGGYNVDGTPVKAASRLARDRGARGRGLGD